VTLWQVDIYPAPGQPDVAAESIVAGVADLGLTRRLSVHSARGYLLEGNLTRADVERLTAELLADPVVERTVIGEIGSAALDAGPLADGQCVHVLPKPGVMDPVALSAQKAIADFGVTVEGVRTFKKYWLSALAPDELSLLCGKVLANESVEQVVLGPLQLRRLDVGESYPFDLMRVPLRALDDAGLERLSRAGQLYLTLIEMQTIQQYYRSLDRDPTDVELETIAQTWSEHCSHKTLAGRIAYRDENGARQFTNMLKETIFAATHEIRQRWARTTGV
jgi:phosphoribosylformylglycinamidine synthase subunit PurSL